MILNLPITILDADIPRLQLATRRTYGQVPDGQGGHRDMTDAEIVERLRLEVVERLRGMVVITERSAAIAAAEALDPQVGVS